MPLWSWFLTIHKLLHCFLFLNFYYVLNNVVFCDFDLSICLVFLRAWHTAELWSFFPSLIVTSMLLYAVTVMLIDTHFVIYSECFDLIKSWAVAKFFPIYQLFTRCCILHSHAAIINGVMRFIVNIECFDCIHLCLFNIKYMFVYSHVLVCIDILWAVSSYIFLSVLLRLVM